MNQKNTQDHVDRTRARARAKHAAESARTGGQELLRSVSAPLNEIATECGVSKALVSNWRTGKLKPQPPERAVLERVYGIPSHEWDVIDMSDEAELEDDGALVFDEDAPPLESTLRMLDQQLQRLASGATDEDFKQAEGIRKMLATRFTAEKDKRVIDAYIERALVNPERQPFYQRTVNAVVDALKPHPEALKDVLAALDAAADEEVT